MREWELREGEPLGQAHTARRGREGLNAASRLRERRMERSRQAGSRMKRRDISSSRPEEPPKQGVFC